MRLQSPPINKEPVLKVVSTVPRRRWTVKQKLAACNLYHQSKTNYSAIAREYPGATPSQIRRWYKAFLLGKYKKVLTSAVTVGSGRTAFYPKLEDTLVTWITKHRQNGHGVSRNAIIMKAKQLMKDPDLIKEYPGLVKFKASLKWLAGFMRRRGLSLRRKTTISQHLPKDLAFKLASFQQYIITYRRKFNPTLKQIANMDETPMWFDMPCETTVDFKG